MTTLGEKIKKECYDSGTTPKHIARKIEFSDGAFSELVNDKYKPLQRQMQHLERIAKSLGIATPAELFKGVDEWEPSNDLQSITDEALIKYLESKGYSVRDAK